MKVMAMLFVPVILVASGCSTWRKLDNTERGAVIGTGAGAAVGTVISPTAGGALLGGAAGGLGGGLIGNEMDDERRRRR